MPSMTNSPHDKRKGFYIHLLDGMLADPNKDLWHPGGWHNLIYLLIQYRDYNIDNNSQSDAMLYKEFVERFKHLEIPDGLDSTNERKEWFKEIQNALKER
jgi:hypothetical protein